MKKAISDLLLLVLLSASSFSLIGQVSACQLDSAVTYTFNSETDSVRSSLSVIQRIDSIHLYEHTWVGQWNVDSAKWLPSVKYFREYDQAGNEINYVWSQWTEDIGWEYTDSVRTDYDAAGNLVFRDSYKWDNGLPGWAGERRDEYFRDGEGDDTLHRVSQWEVAVNDWQYSSLQRIIYDQESRIIEDLNYNWNSNDQVWEISSWRQREYIFDLSGRVETQNGYILNPADSTRVHAYYLDYSYDNRDRVLTEDYNSLDGGEISMRILAEYAWDADGNKTLHSGMTWIYQADTMVFGNREVFAFNAQGQETLKEILIWDAVLEDWLLQGRNITTYNEDGLIFSTESSDYQYPDDKFTQTLTEYLYTSSGRNSVKIIYIKYTYEQSLHLRSKVFFYPTAYYFSSYDSICPGTAYLWKGGEVHAAGVYEAAYVTGMGTDSIYTLYLSEKPAPASFTISGPAEVVPEEEAIYIADENVEVQYTWNVENGTVLSGSDNDSLLVRWESSGTGKVAAWAMNEFGCSSDTIAVQVLVVDASGMEKPVTGHLLLYPVPVRDHLMIESPVTVGRVELLDLYGRKVASAIGPSIELSFLPAGIYIIQIKNTGGELIWSQNIIKE